MVRSHEGAISLAGTPPASIEIMRSLQYPKHDLDVL